MKKVLLLFFLLFLICPLFALAAAQVDINIASLAQLDTLTGIGPVYAQGIIDGRPYSSLDGLLNVKGIGPKTLQKIKDQGVAYVGTLSVIPSLTGNPDPTNVASTLDSRLRGNDNVIATPAVVYPGGVFINEILPNPKGADETDEWVELYNSNNFDVDLAGWQLQDKVGTITTYTIPENTKILAGGFLVFKRPSTNIMINNDRDGLNLSTPDKKISDSVNFTSAPLGQSYSKNNSDWQWSTTLTPGAKNIITGTVIKTLSKAKNSVKNSDINPLAADLTQGATQTNGATNPYYLFFAVLGATIILAIVVLFISIRFKNYKNLKN